MESQAMTGFLAFEWLPAIVISADVTKAPVAAMLVFASEWPSI
jgi:hypothetical protein